MSMSRQDLLGILEMVTALTTAARTLIEDMPPADSMPIWAKALVLWLDEAVKLPAKVGMIMTTQSELAAIINTVNQSLTAFSAQFAKARDEITAEIQALKDAVTQAGNVTPELQSAVDALAQSSSSLGTLAQTLDDLNPDPVVTPPDVTPPEQPASAKRR